MRVRSTRQGRLAAVLLFTLIALAGCRGGDIEQTLSRQLIHLHEQMNGGDLEGIWNAADPGFRQGVSHDDFLRLMSSNHRRLGDAGGGVLLDTDVYTSFKGTYVTQRLITDFANDPEGHEHIVWFGTDGQLRLFRYDVSSKLLQ